MEHPPAVAVLRMAAKRDVGGSGSLFVQLTLCFGTLVLKHLNYGLSWNSCPHPSRDKMAA